jgi:hypothetical protein
VAAPSDPFIDRLRTLVGELREHAEGVAAQTMQQHEMRLEATPGAEPGVYAVSVSMIIEPLTEEWAVEEEGVTFRLTPQAIEDLEFRPYAVGGGVEAPVPRSAEVEDLLIQRIDVFFRDRMGPGLAV